MIRNANTGRNKGSGNMSYSIVSGVAENNDVKHCTNSCEGCLCDTCSGACQNCLMCAKAEYAENDWEDMYTDECEGFEEA